MDWKRKREKANRLVVALEELHGSATRLDWRTVSHTLLKSGLWSSWSLRFASGHEVEVANIQKKMLWSDETMNNVLGY